MNTSFGMRGLLSIASTSLILALLVSGSVVAHADDNAQSADQGSGAGAYVNTDQYQIVSVNDTQYQQDINASQVQNIADQAAGPSVNNDQVQAASDSQVQQNNADQGSGAYVNGDQVQAASDSQVQQNNADQGYALYGDDSNAGY